MSNPPQEGASPGASLFVPITISPGETKTVRVMLAWYVPVTNLRFGTDPQGAPKVENATCGSSSFYVPWYAGKFKSLEEIADYWRLKYDFLREKSVLFRDTFYDTTLPAEVVEAVAANLTILKSPTVLRQTDGRLWCFEGCSDDRGCCHGSCTHVWNYAQAIPHLFPDLERSLRQTEFNESQDERGHQTFRSALPIRPVTTNSMPRRMDSLGNHEGLPGLAHFRGHRLAEGLVAQGQVEPGLRHPHLDPRGRGVLEEPHHNTYDIEYWGPDGHCSSFYLGALQGAIEMGTALGDDVSVYRELLEKGIRYLESELYNGEYFSRRFRQRV